MEFYCLTKNSATDAAIGEAQLAVEVTSTGPGRAFFEFRNVGGNASSITDIYWQGGSLLALNCLIDSDDGDGGHVGVDFSPGASPGNLPGGNEAWPKFKADKGFLTDSDPPARPNGVDAGEWLSVCYTLTDGTSYEDVIAELTNGTMRIGMHVQGFDSGGSESFISIPIGGHAPEPASAGILAMAGIWLLRRRRI